ncbi:putative 2-aminoethylphosphonate ABC transporter ATP-binding protein [Pelomonas aquatica]|uniref:2-aminoethylphosphonate ABC transporter ATP-binding protein n=1 Tax=Pelomonas aquatica TaxID=431058 RepID=A0A9X4LKF6_9BURK|nr:putative 2-aminoethylphosphonate ABC transporter ATP-binding protein [Pelomonas aquatica]MCY4755374.1 putative 2-aminoethylphosphonate ABC transporter ATP-binding protein [Pelomonas aquatica]MDG0861758.1 putative 2-aminoethylphosphonate ABC transporter ATP-binding protein [Pelomonas aquatica]
MTAGTDDAWLRFAGIRKRFGDFEALAGIDLAIRKGEFVCLLGPSGCGKTTLLRILAGLEAQDAGTLHLGSKDIGRLPPSQRDYGIVFQSYALFPNLTVAGNVGYGLRLPRAPRERRIAELLDLVGLPGSAARYPAQLSGGQQQRVALARALATSPSLLLLDEPLSALDAQVREHLRRELRSLQQRLGVTTLMVTHDQDEALALGDTIAVMSAGRLEQVGTPEQIYREPATRFVADFVGRANWLPVQLDADGRVRLAGCSIDCPAALVRTGPAGAAAPQRATLFCRPEDVQVQPEWQPGANTLLATVDRVDFMGGLRRAELRLMAQPELTLWADVAPHDPGAAALLPGRRVPVRLQPQGLRLFDAGAAQ